MDPLLSLGKLSGAHGAPVARRQFGAQVQAPIRSDAATGTQLGDTAVRLTRSAFLRNLQLVAVAIVKVRPALGHPAAPADSGWDGRPLDGS